MPSCLDYFCSLFKDNVSNSDYVVYSDWMTVNNELGTILKEAVMV
jgi:hypothetical protein